MQATSVRLHRPSHPGSSRPRYLVGFAALTTPLYKWRATR
jgi:hypothetical protein